MAQVDLTVAIENLAPAAGTNLTPVWVGFHDGGFDVYTEGESLNDFPGTEELAEDGTFEQINAQFDTVGAGTTQGTVGGGPIAPGDTVTESFTLDSSDPSSRYFSYASMILPSNDAFVANDNPFAVEIFSETGGFQGAEFIIPGAAVEDAGTEVNDEVPENTAFFGQQEPQTGIDQTAPVVAHPGFIPDGPILNAFPGADFTSEGYEVSRITVTEVSSDGNESTIEVTVENLAPEQGTNLTPVWVGIHDGGFDIYNRGESLLNFPGTEELAEDGSTDPISAQFDTVGAGTVQGTVGGGPIAPGTTVTETFTIDRSAPSSRYFSYASMILPSNDAFVANGDPLAFEIVDAEGNFVGADFTVLGSQVLDAGTEINDEVPENTAFFGQQEPQTGVVEHAPVAAHPGFIPEGPILDAFPEADFTSEGYEVARVTVTATSSLVFGGTGDDSLDSAISSDFDGTGDLAFTGDGADLVDVSTGAGSNRIYTSGSSDEIFAGTGDRINAGPGDDTIDSSVGGGLNRIYAGDGDDLLLLGTGDRALGQAGADRFFFPNGGGDSVITGGADADQFWIANGELPEAPNTVTDFAGGEDVIGVAGLGLDEFADLTLTGSDDTTIAALGTDLAVLLGVSPDDLSAADFAIAPGGVTV